MDISSISTGLALIKSAKDTAKFALDIAKGYDAAELKLQIIDLVGKLSEIQSSFADAKLEIIELKSNIEQLESDLAFHSKLVFDRFAYFTVEGDGPYCQKCYDSDRKSVRLQKEYFLSVLNYKCYNCENTFDPNPQPHDSYPTALDDY